jgi:UDPglucose 6-dehydrogenase
MSLESAEMSKHALNAFLALSATYANEIARLCEAVGADAFEVERALRADSRVGPSAYVSPGGPIAGGTLARDVAFLDDLSRRLEVQIPLLGAIPPSNAVQRQWARTHIEACVRGIPDPRVAILGLTYKPGTDTLRRSAAVELGLALACDGFDVAAFDPAIHALPPESHSITLAPSAEAALDSADVAVLMTAWPEFQRLQASELARRMRHPQVVDESGFLRHLATASGIRYTCLGRA